MKNKEKYAEEIFDVFVNEVKGCDFRTKYVLKSDSCDNISCEECRIKTKEWLEAEYVPPKTRQSEFLKLFPNAKIREGVIDIEPCKIIKTFETTTCHSCVSNCNNCRKGYWSEEID